MRGGAAWVGMWLGWVWLGWVWLGWVWLGWVWLGWVWLGWVWLGWVWLALLLGPGGGAWSPGLVRAGCMYARIHTLDIASRVVCSMVRERQCRFRRRPWLWSPRAGPGPGPGLPRPPGSGP